MRPPKAAAPPALRTHAAPPRPPTAVRSPHACRYISIAGPEPEDGATAYSLVASLVESPVISQYIPLDAEQAAQEKCGRFCVVLAPGAEEDDTQTSAAAPRRLGGAALLRWLATGAAAALALSLGRRLG